MLARGIKEEDARRSFASSALRRCIQKLEGKYPTLASPAKDGEVQQVQCSVVQQADRLIKMASSDDNLSRIFEGWMPWI